MKVFLANFNGVMDEVQKHVNLVPIDDADVILTWQDVEESFIHLALAAKYLGKKIILLSHCFGSTNDYLPPHSHASYADKILVWGQADYALALQAGLAHKTVITGTPIFNRVKPKQKHDGINIVFCPTHSIHHEQQNYAIAEKLRAYNATIYTKILEGMESEKYDNQVLSKRMNNTEHIDVVFDILSKADVVVVNDPTCSFALFAFTAGVPVIYVKNVDKHYYHIDMYLRSGEYETALADLDTTLDEVLANDTKEEQRKIWCDYCGVNIKNPLENILREINNI